MAEAEVGDDVYGEDPTINRLEERAAELMGREAAALRSDRHHGQSDRHPPPHPTRHRGRGRGGCAHLQFRDGRHGGPIGSSAAADPTTDDGILDARTRWRQRSNPPAGYRTPTSLVVLENSHNLAGGRVTPPERMAELVAVAQRHGLPVHLDGARIHNAAAALGVTAAELGAGCDTVMFCLSKGLGAPVGSVLVGDADAMAEARRMRKMFGGGMRQAGIIAAAGLVALDEVLPEAGRGQSPRPAARRWTGRASRRSCSTPRPWRPTSSSSRSPKTRRSTPRGSPPGSPRQGVLCHPLGGDSIRMVTHYHITDDDIDEGGRGDGESAQD